MGSHEKKVWIPKIVCLKIWNPTACKTEHLDMKREINWVDKSARGECKQTSNNTFKKCKRSPTLTTKTKCILIFLGRKHYQQLFNTYSTPILQSFRSFLILKAPLTSHRWLSYMVKVSKRTNTSQMSRHFTPNRPFFL